MKEKLEVLRLENGDIMYLLNGVELKKTYSLSVRNHSPDGFSHGYSGSGPSQLSLAICLEWFSRPGALAMYQSFKQRVIANIPMEFSGTVEIDMEKFFAGEDSCHTLLSNVFYDDFNI